MYIPVLIIDHMRKWKSAQERVSSKRNEGCLCLNWFESVIEDEVLGARKGFVLKNTSSGPNHIKQLPWYHTLYTYTVILTRIIKNIFKTERVCRDIYQNRIKHRNKMALATK